jgi:hypothetical protein
MRILVNFTDPAGKKQSLVLQTRHDFHEAMLWWAGKTASEIFTMYEDVVNYVHKEDFDRPQLRKLTAKESREFKYQYWDGYLNIGDSVKNTNLSLRRGHRFHRMPNMAVHFANKKRGQQ